MSNGGNRWVKGIIADLPAVDVSNQHWVFPTVNVRITKQGDVFIAKPVSGNEVLFTIDPLYQIIGAEEYSDILYLVLYKATDNKIQVGTYPHYNGSVKTFSYRALQCLDAGADFITDALGFDDSTVDLEFADSYDETVDIYLNQVGSPTIKINSNMTTNGSLSNFILESTLPYSAYLVSDVANPMNIDSVVLSSGGKIEPGKYIIFLRYSTKDYNKTTFLVESSPFDVHGTINSDYKAGQFLLDDEKVKYVNTKIELNLSNLDESFLYYQIAVLIASGNPNEEVTYKGYLISQYFRTSQGKVIIDGFESRETLSLDEILAISFNDNINKCQTIIDNRYIGGNWESEGYIRSSLSSLAYLVKIDGVAELTGTVTDAPTYFPGEVYPFGIVFRFVDGRESESFPIKGWDFVEDIELVKGLVRMPYTLNNAELKNFGLTLDLNFLETALLSRDDILGYTIVRGERIKNVLANGIAKGMIDNVGFREYVGYPELTDLYGAVFNEYFYSKTEEGAFAIPDFFEGFYPLYRSPVDPASTKIAFQNGSELDIFTPQKADQLTKKVAVFSPDVSLTNEFENMDMETVYVSQSGSTTLLTKTIVVDEALTNYTVRVPQAAKLYNHYEYNNDGIKALIAHPAVINGSYVQKGIKRVDGSFSAFIPDPYLDGDSAFTRLRYQSNDLTWGLYTRSGLFGSYIGLTSVDSIASLIDNPVVITRYATKELYIASVIDNFQIRNTVYAKISQFINKGDVVTINVFNGDSYVGNVSLRGVKWFGAKNLYEIDIGTEKYSYHHGTLISFNCFSSVNFYMRGDVDSVDPSGSEGKYSFWPRAFTRNSLEGWNILSSNEEDMHESNSINQGYNKSLSPKPYIGYDDVSPVLSSKYPTRIRNSAVRIKGAFFDGFKTFYTNDKIDIPEKFGPIVGVYNMQEMLIAVQHRAISKIYTNVRQTTSEGSFDIVVGSSQQFLYDVPYIMSSYGAINRDHIISTERNIYGIDVDNKIIWIVSVNGTPEGKQISGVQDIGKEKLITKYIFDLLTFFKQEEINYTVNLGYDKFNLEVLFTFKWEDSLLASDDYEGSYVRNGYRYLTLVFSESLGAFTGLYSLPADRYAQFKTNLVSIANNAYIHNRDSAQLNFFGMDYSMLLSWIVNNAGEDAPPLVKKFFEAVTISCPEIPLKNIKFRTESQSSELNPFIDETKFWQTPKYNEFQYEISIPTNETNNAIFEIDSVMKGFWLKITVEFEGEEAFYMVHSDTLFNPINY